MGHLTFRLRGRVLALCILIASIPACSRRSTPRVVVYTSVDQVYSEPILQSFEAETGVRVLPVYDVEAAKTTGLVQRLMAERSRPRADVFWNGEFLQTLALEHAGALARYLSPSRTGIRSQWLDPGGYWTGLGGRFRVLLVNARGRVPASLEAITGPRAGIAYPLFGTSASHAAALYAALGPAAARRWYQGLRRSGVRVVDGNSVVRDLVVSGQLAVGLTDSDDACGAIRAGAGVRIVVPEGTLVIPGTVALVDGAPHPDEGRRLIDWLLTARTERRLIESGFSQISVRTGRVEAACPAPGPVPDPGTPLEAIAAQFSTSRADLEALFVR